MDKTIFEVEISNSGPKSYETATVMKMPASFAEFSDALQKARIKDGTMPPRGITRTLVKTVSPKPTTSACGTP